LTLDSEVVAGALPPGVASAVWVVRADG
jgi:hypothetical protein